MILINGRYSYSQVQVLLQQPPPNQLHIEDLWKLTLNNTSGGSYSVYLVGKVTEASRGEVLTAVTKNFILNQGLKVLNSKELGDVEINYQNKDIEDMISKTGSVQSGYYTICITVYSLPDNIAIGERCINQTVNNLSIPILVSPFNSSTVSELLPFFSWMPPSPVIAGQRITYTLTVVEILPRQSPSDAMLSNPQWYEISNLITSGTVYQMSSRMFTEGKRYAWKVKAYLNGVFLNESEIWQFSYISISDSLKRNKQNKIKEKNSGGVLNQYGNLQLSIDQSLIPGGYLSRGKTFDCLKLKESAGLKLTQIKKQPTFVLNGTSKVYGQNANRISTYSEQPADFLRWELNPSVSIYNVPLSAALLLSTEQKSSKQNINNFAFNFDPNKLIQQIKNKAIEKSVSPVLNNEYDEIKVRLKDANITIEEKEKLNARLKDLEKIKIDAANLQAVSDPDEFIREAENQNVRISGFSKFLLSIRNLGIGTNYPKFTEFTLNEIPVTGLNIEVNPGLLYFAFSGIRNLKAIQKSENNLPVYGRKTIGSRLGIGKYSGTHFYLTHVYAWDDEKSIITDSSTVVTPMKNHVLGLEMALSFFKGILNFEAEAGASLLTRDVRSPDIKNSDIPSFVQNLFGIKMSSSLDYYYSLKTSLHIDKTGTKFSSGIKMVGPGYSSLGTQNLRNDYLGFDVRLDQNILSNRISFSTFLKRDRDNLISWKRTTTTNTSFGFVMNVNFPGIPFLTFNYSPFFQKNDQNIDSLKIDNRLSLYTLSTGYGYPIGILFAFTNLGFSLQESKTASKLFDFSSNTFTFNQSFTFHFPLTITGGFGHTEIRLTNSYNKMIYYDFSSSYLFFNTVQMTGGLNIAKEMKNNNKLGIYLNSNIALWFLGNLDLRAEKNIYNDNISHTGSYDEFVFKATLSTNW